MEDFLLSAGAIGPVFEQAEYLSVGEMVLKAVEATRCRVKSNTNLGIILLLAPLAKACCGGCSLDDVRKNLHRVLQELSVEDARSAYKAIRIAKPGGMGKVSDSDVSEQPSITLLKAMGLAQERDSVAREYATDFAISFEIGLPALQTTLMRGVEFSLAVVQCFLTILSRVPDTLIARKRDTEMAQRVSMQAEAALAQGGVFTSSGEKAIKMMDQVLRDPDHTLNPGTTADLTTAAIFLALLESDLPESLASKAWRH